MARPPSIQTPEQDIAELELLRAQAERIFLRVLFLIGTQNFKAWVAGVELGCLMRWTRKHGGSDGR